MQMLRCTGFMALALIAGCSPAAQPETAASAQNIPATDNFGVPFADSIPADVRRFIVRRQGCDHFRGEPPYDAQRRAFLEERIKQTCTGTDAELAGLRQKYSDDRAVTDVLSGFENFIELP